MTRAAPAFAASKQLRDRAAAVNAELTRDRRFATPPERLVLIGAGERGKMLPPSDARWLLAKIEGKAP